VCPSEAVHEDVTAALQAAQAKGHGGEQEAQTRFALFLVGGQAVPTIVVPLSHRQVVVTVPTRVLVVVVQLAVFARFCTVNYTSHLDLLKEIVVSRSAVVSDVEHTPTLRMAPQYVDVVVALVAVA